ncbi:Centrosomal protein of 78 kDa [Lamellibrachia satsuma]|nr:Centrosomal protein of 78 kDa [Lamellibrachia satsuma]
MIESVAVRQRGAYDFETHYNNLCALQNSCPIPAVKAHLACGKLDINGDRMRTTDWMPILNTLRINKTLSSVSVHSYYQQQLEDEERQGFRQKKIPAIRSKEITYRLCKALKECLWVTPALSSLELHGLPLRSRDLTALAKGLMKNGTLKHISLEGSRVADEGLEIICKGVKNSASVTSLNFSGCSLGWKGADILARVIKFPTLSMSRLNQEEQGFNDLAVSYAWLVAATPHGPSSPSAV